MIEPDGRLDEMVALWIADSAEELQRALVLGAPVLSDSHDAFEPLMLFQSAHKNRPQGAVQTAMLLLTDRRWRRAIHRLVPAIDESGLIPDDHLDLLARAFLAAGDALYWEVPTEWLEGAVVVLDRPDVTDDRPCGPEAGSEETPVVVARLVQPPLRRWGAARLLRAEPDAWPGIVRRARELGSTGGAAVMAGLVEAADVLADDAQAALIAVALDWSARAPRLAALEHLARHGESDRAGERARHDPDAAIRRWARQLERRQRRLDVEAATPSPVSPTSETAPATLF